MPKSNVSIVKDGQLQNGERFFLAPTLTQSQEVPALISQSLSGRIRRFAILPLYFALLVAFAALQGCSSSQSIASTSSSQTPTTPTISLQPSSANIQMWQNVQFSVVGDTTGAACTWNAPQASILANLGDGQFQGAQQGTTQVSVTCGSLSATANVVVSTQVASGPIVITSGGTYSGNWNSTDPNTPAVTIQTDQPVTLEDSVITSRGALMTISGVKTGANVTVENITGTALDPGVAGTQRGAFINATNIASLTVKNCSMTGVSFGVKVTGATPSTLEILNNSASELEDRASDGQGGFEANRPSLGHFVLLNEVTAASGAEIAWNQVKQTIGQSSTEDVINIYNSQGSQGHPIHVHDNYMDGSSSPVFTNHYTGTALITDGATTNGAQPSAYVLFEANEIVATAGTGVGIAAGHDIQATANRVVSCGVTSGGSWYAWGASAVVIWNYYASSQFYNNSVTGTVGGMVGPGTNNAPAPFDVSVINPTTLGTNVSTTDNDFTDPCLAAGGVNLQAENNERAYWTSKLASNAEVVGDQHLN